MARLSRPPGPVAAVALCVVLASPLLSACGGSDSGAAASDAVSSESYRQAFCGARTSFQALAQTMAARGSAPLNQTDLASDQKTRLAFVDGLVDGADVIVKALAAAGTPDVQGGQAGAEATVEVYQAVDDKFAAARKNFAAAAVGERAEYLAAVKKLQAALVDAVNSLGTEAAKEMSAIDPQFNAILRCS